VNGGVKTPILSPPFEKVTAATAAKVNFFSSYPVLSGLHILSHMLLQTNGEQT
jgi:hypothetical protein